MNLRMICLAVVITALFVMCAVLPASAQYGAYGQENRGTTWSVRAGYLFPQGDTPDSSEFTIGFEALAGTSQNIGGMNVIPGISADWVQITSTTILGETRDVTVIPAFVNLKARTRPAGESGGWEYGFGLGVYWVDKDIPEMRLSNGTQFAWQLDASYEFTRSYYLEARYMASNHPSDSGMWGLEAGYRF